MTSYLYPGHFDLVTPDGHIVSIKAIDESTALAEVKIDGISPAFVGFQVPKERIFFNFRSVLAQLGLNTGTEEFSLDPKNGIAHVKLTISAIGPLGRQMLTFLETGAFIGKLFAADERRLVRNPDYLTRMFGRSDKDGRPLLSLGGMQGSEQLVLEKVDGHTVAFLALKKGRIEYDTKIHGLLPTIGKALKIQKLPLRDFIALQQMWKPNIPRVVRTDEMLLVATYPLHIRTVFAKVVNALLPQGFYHTSANVLQPDTQASGDVYEFYGKAETELFDVPLEFYTLEPHREHIFFEDRDQLQQCLEDPRSVFDAFETAPKPEDLRAAIFIVKGKQMLRLKELDWICREPTKQPFPGITHGTRQSLMAERYIELQPTYPFLKAIEEGLITSQGVLFTRYFPSPILKRMLLSYHVQGCLKGIYFQIPSHSNGIYFSQEDRSMLLDLVVFGIPVFWADKTSGQLLQYIQRPGKATGMFVPLNRIDTFLKSTFFGIYGSNLIAGNFEEELKKLLKGVLEMRKEVHHPLLHEGTPLALVTGGGPGAMEMGNKMAKELKILSCANIVDFTPRNESVVNEQKLNPFVEAKMTYRLDHLVERQAEFYLDFPIFVMGGIGTDFEFALEELRNKVGGRPPGPILLFGEPSYWKDKLTSRFRCNLQNGTIKGSEWVSNTFHCVQNAEAGLNVYKDFFLGKLPIGPTGPIYEEGFIAD
jgi:predicted Rossmann-fold nucleotide-binding protein